MSVGTGGNMSNFPGGFGGGIAIRGVPILNTHPGNVFWVDSGGPSNSRGTFKQPFTTIGAALDRCTASNGDIIFVKPGHAETITAAGGVALDVAGVAVVGLGKGSIRPTLTYTTAAAASLTVTAADVSLSNFRLVANFADITRLINVTATDFHADGIEVTAAAVDMNWVDVIDASGADNTADGLTVTNCRAFGLDASNDSFIEITGDIDRLTVEDNLVVHDHASATAFIEQATGKDMINVSIQRNSYHSLKTSGDILIDNDTTANSGVAAYNTMSHADTAAEVALDVDGVAMFENYASGVITGSGYLLPAADS